MSNLPECDTNNGHWLTKFIHVGCVSLWSYSCINASLGNDPANHPQSIPGRARLGYGKHGGNEFQPSRGLWRLCAWQTIRKWLASHALFPGHRLLLVWIHEVYTCSRQGFHPYTAPLQISNTSIFLAILVRRVVFLDKKNLPLVLTRTPVGTLDNVPYVVYSILNWRIAASWLS